MHTWSRDIPKEPGYYWAKVFSSNTDPQIVLLTSDFRVLRCGTRDAVSTYYDIKEWWSEPVGAPS